MAVTFSFSVSTVPATVPATSSSASSDGGATAPRDKALDTLTGDLLFDGNADQVYTEGIEGIASDLKSNWLFFKGEWFLNINKGIDYWGVIFAKGSTIEACEEEYRREALATPGVSAIDLQLTKTGRRLDVRGVVTTDLGLIFKVVLGVNAG